MAGIGSRKRTGGGGGGDSARRLFERKETHASVSPKRSTNNKSTHTSGTSDSMTLDQSIASWEHASKSSPDTPVGARRKQRKPPTFHTIVPRIQRRPMQFFPNTSPTPPREESPCSLTSGRSFENPLVDENDSVCSGPVRRPQHDEQQSQCALHSQLVGDTSLRGVSRDNSTPLYKMDHDAYSDFTGASTEIATNRAVDMVMNKIREIEKEGSKGLDELDSQSTEYLPSQHQTQYRHSRYQAQNQVSPHHRYNMQMPKQTHNPVVQEALIRIATSRRQLASKVGVWRRTSEAKSLLSESSNEDGFRICSPFLSTDGDNQNNSLIEHGDCSSLQSCSISSSVGVEIHQGKQMRTKVPVMKAIFRPRRDVVEEEESAWHSEHRSGALLIPELRTFSSQQQGSSDNEEKQMLYIRNKLSSETPDPVFCSYPESPSTHGGSYGSDYVSIANFGDRSITTPSRDKREPGVHGVENLEQQWQTKLSQVREQQSVESTELPDDSAVALNRNDSDDAVILDSDGGQPTPNGHMNDYFRTHDKGRKVRAKPGGVSEYSSNMIGRAIDVQYSKQSTTRVGAHLPFVATKADGDTLFRGSKVQNYARAVNHLNRTWPPRTNDTTTFVKESENKEVVQCYQNQDVSGPCYLESSHSELMNSQNQLASDSNTCLTDENRGSVTDEFKTTKKKKIGDSDARHDSRTARVKKEGLSSFLSRDHLDLPTDVKSVRSAFENMSRGFENNTYDDDDDTASVRSLKEMFEKPQLPREVGNEVKKLAAMFESKKNRANKRFECENVSIKNAYSKFEDSAVKAKRAPVTRYFDNIPVENKAHTENFVENESSNVPRVSVADRIKALSANSGNAFKSRFASQPSTSVSKIKPKQRVGMVKSQSSESRVTASVGNANFESHSTEIRTNPERKELNMHTGSHEQDNQTFIPDDSTNMNMSRTNFKPDEQNIRTVFSDENTKEPRPFTRKVPDIGPSTQKVVYGRKLPFLSRRGAAYSSCQSDSPAEAVRPPVLGSQETKQGDSFKSGAWSTNLVVHDSEKATIENPMKYTTSVPSNQRFNARRVITSNVSQVKVKSSGQKADDSNSGSDDLSDGVTIDVSIAEVSNLTVPTDMGAVDEDGSSDASVRAPSDMMDSTAKKSEASSSQPSEAMVPLIAKTMRMRPMSDEMSADSFFTKRAIMASRKNDSDRNVEAIGSENQRNAGNNLLPTLKTIKTNDDSIGSGWDLQQVATSFPDTATTTSSSDLFEFESGWQSSPTHKKSDHDDRITPAINKRKPMATGSSLARVSNETETEFQLGLGGSPRAPNAPKLFSSKERLYNSDKISPPAFSQTGPARTTSPRIAGPNFPGKKKNLPSWKKRLGVSSPVPQSEWKDAAIPPPNLITPPSVTKSEQGSRLPPPRNMENPSSNSAQYANLMSRLMKLKQARRMRTALAYSAPVDDSSFKIPGDIPNFADSSFPLGDNLSNDPEPDDVSSSSVSSTHFGGSTFMEALEVD